MALTPREHNLLRARLGDHGEALPLRAAALLALVAASEEEALENAQRMAEVFSDGADAANVTAAMAPGFALAHSGAPSTEVAQRFNPALREHVAWAARLQRTAMDADAARENGHGEDMCQSVHLTPGEGRFARSFKMGSPEDQHAKDFDDQSYPSEQPQREVAIMRPFALGRFTVTQT